MDLGLTRSRSSLRLRLPKLSRPRRCPVVANPALHVLINVISVLIVGVTVVKLKWYLLLL